MSSSSFLKADLTAIAGDVDGDTLIVKNISATNGVGTFENADGDFVFGSIDDFNGATEFTYQIADANDAYALDSEGTPLTITGNFIVTAVDDAPRKIGGAINDLTLEDGPSTSLGLEALAFNPGGSGDYTETDQTISFTIEASRKSFSEPSSWRMAMPSR